MSSFLLSFALPRLYRIADETLPPRQTLFAVPLSCDGCVKSVSDALYSLGGITKVEGNLKDQLISVEGSGTFRPCSPLHRPTAGNISMHV